MNGQFDYLILGSGISGMTLALLFASCGAEVVVVERASSWGGAMQRFRRQGTALDTGFHFTGGEADCFGDMLTILGLRDKIHCSPVKQKIFFRGSPDGLNLPSGIGELEKFLSERYPEQESGIHAYFQAQRNIFMQTPLFHLQSPQAFLTELPDLPEDHITLDEFFDRNNIHGELRCILSAVCGCHGTAPGEISFANHARIHYGLSNDPCRLTGGGDSFVQAFLERAQELNITLLKNCTVKKWGQEDQKGKIYSAELTDGTTLQFKNLIFTQHPKEILRMLPREKLRPQFLDRINSFSDTCGFYSWYAVLEGEDISGFEESLGFNLSTLDLNRILSEDHPEEKLTGFVLSLEEKSDGTFCKCVTAFQSVFANETAAFADSKLNYRPEEYRLYKEAKNREIETLFYKLYPQFRNKAKCISSSSMLTFRDYLGSTGSAYGITQKIGQNNLFGRLPVRNFYTSSQSSFLPGAVGAMLSALTLFRKLAGEECYAAMLKKLEGGNAL